MKKLLGYFSGLGLQYKFILITTCAIIVTMSAIGYFAVEREKSILYTEVEKQGRLLGETLAIPIINDLIYERLGLVEEGGLLDNYIMEIFNRPDSNLLYIAILDDEGKIISHNDITQYGKLYSDALTSKALASDMIVVQDVSLKQQHALDFGVPLSIGKKRWGTLKFGLSLEAAEREIAASPEDRRADGCPSRRGFCHYPAFEQKIYQSHNATCDMINGKVRRIIWMYVSI